MPIYAYKCSACGFAKDVLQKVSDAPLTVCPSCHANAFAKQLTAAGFQLKGSGWYATDFAGKPAPTKTDGDGASPAAASGATPAPAPAADGAAASAPAAPAPAPAAKTSNPGSSDH